MRFAIKVDPWWRPLLVLFGATAERAYVALDGDWLDVRFGFWRHRFSRRQLVGARRVDGRWTYGIGWHTNFTRALIVNGSLDGLVELSFDPPEPTRLLGIPIRCSRLYVSLEDPADFLRALG